MKNALVVGGGLAGLVAARALAQSGRYRPVVLESSPLVGGMAACWRDNSGGLVETGLHVCFPYYRHLLGLVRELGIDGAIAWGGPAFSYVRRGGGLSELRLPRLPPPIHGAVAVARLRHLSLFDRISAIVGAAEATLSCAAWRARYESIVFAEWAKRRGLSKRLVTEVFEPMVGGLTFLRADEVSARAMLDYIHAIGSRAGACGVGMFRGAVGDVLIQPIAADVMRRGGEVRTASRVTQLLHRAGRTVGVRLADGRDLLAETVIAAVPSHALAAIAPTLVQDNASVHKAARLRHVPVASVLVGFDRKLHGPPGLRFSPGCVFNTWADMTDVLRELEGSNRSLLQLVVAPLGAGHDSDDAALAARVVADVRAVLPHSRSAAVERLVVTRTERSMHAVVPGAEALRPATDVGVAGLFLAGDYVRTGLSPSLESAVVSGLRAARAAIEATA